MENFGGGGELLDGDIDELMSRSMGATYCWGIPRGMVLGLGEIGVGMEGGRLRTRG